MIVTCPACKRTYRLDDSLVKSPYQKMRCSRCGHIFVNLPDQGRSEENRSAGPSPLSGAERKSVPVRRGSLMLVASVLVFLGLVVAGYFFWVNDLGAGNRWLSIQRIEGQELVAKDGPIFLINGLVFNGSTKPRRRVILKGKLFDESAAVIGQQMAVAGAPFSTDGLASMMTSDIEERAAEATKSDPAALVLYPHKGMPFSIVVAGPYSGTPKEFTVEIVDSPFL